MMSLCRIRVNDPCCFAVLTIIASFFINAVFDGIQYSVGILYVVMLERFGSTRTSTVLISSIWCFTAYAMSYPAGLLIRRTSTRTVGVVGALLGTASFISSAHAHTVYVLYFTYSVMGGTAYAFLIMASMVSVTSHHTKHRALAVGFAQAGTGTGVFLFSPLLSLIFHRYSWTNSCILLAAIYLQTLVCAAVLRPVYRSRRLSQADQQILMGVETEKLPETQDSEEKISLQPDTDNADTQTVLNDEDLYLQVKETSSAKLYGSASQLAIYNSGRTITALPDTVVRFPKRSFRDKVLCLTLTLSTIFPHCGLSVYLLFLPDFVLSQGVSEQSAALLVSALGVSDLSGRLFGGFLGHYLEKWTYYVYSGAVLVMGLVLMLTPDSRTLVHFLVGSIAIGVCNGMRICQLPVLIAEFAGADKFPTYFGLSWTLAGIIISLVLPALGYVSESGSAYWKVFTGTGCIVLLSSILLFLIHILLSWRERRLHKRRERHTVHE